MAVRIGIGLLIGIGMFYFREAHAATQCTPSAAQAPSGPWSAYPSPGPGNQNTYCPHSWAGTGQCIQGSTPRTYTTPQAAANGWADSRGHPQWSEDKDAGANVVKGRTSTCASTGDFNRIVRIETTLSCPGGAQAVNGQCPTPCPTAGTRAYHYFTSEPTFESCDNLCGYTAVTGPDAHRFTVDDTTTQSALYESTGNACTATVQRPDPVDPPNPCKVVQGNTVCTLEDEPLCITINGNKVCTSNNTAGFCTTAECQTLAAALKLPDNTVVSTPDAVGAPLPYGSQTQARPADATIPTTSRTGPPTGTPGANITISPMLVHSPSTVAGSCTGPCAPGEVPGTDPDDEGASGGDGEGEGEEEGQDEGTFTGADFGEAPTFSESFSTFSGAVNGSPVVQAANGVASALAIGAGQCPRPQMTLFSRQIVIDIHCDVVEQNKALLQAASIFAAAVFAVMLFLKA